MADFKFSCPNCGQGVMCDELWSGHQIQCPSCQAEITVPSPQQSGFSTTTGRKGPVEVPSGGSRLAINPGYHASHGAKPAPVVRTLIEKPRPKKSPLIKVLVIVIVLAALSGGVFYGYPWLKEYQEKKAKQAEAEGGGGGGQVGHIAELNTVLDATDPSHPDLSRLDKRRARPDAASAAAAPTPGAAPAAPGKELPLVPAVWTLDLAAAKIPEGKANGKIAGTNFVVETARIDKVGATHVLGLRQGPPTSPDREFLIYLHTTAGESPTGHTWTVSTDMKGSAVPQVAKRWKKDPRYAPQDKRFSTGYAMKLELGQMNENNLIDGKIFLAVPDPEQSVVAGLFKASLGAPADVSQAPTTATEPSAAMNRNAEFMRRYGLSGKRP